MTFPYLEADNGRGVGRVLRGARGSPRPICSASALTAAEPRRARARAPDNNAHAASRARSRARDPNRPAPSARLEIRRRPQSTRLAAGSPCRLLSRGLAKPRGGRIGGDPAVRWTAETRQKPSRICMRSVDALESECVNHFSPLNYGPRPERWRTLIMLIQPGDTSWAGAIARCLFWRLNCFIFGVRLFCASCGIYMLLWLGVLP